MGFWSRSGDVELLVLESIGFQSSKQDLPTGLHLAPREVRQQLNREGSAKGSGQFWKITCSTWNQDG